MGTHKIMRTDLVLKMQAQMEKDQAMQAAMTLMSLCEEKKEALTKKEPC